MAISMKRKPSFFRVLLGDFSKQLAFVKNFKGTSLGKCVLRSPTGEFWRVNVEENVNGLFFRSGWQEFAKFHSLKNGDFLVLKYYGKSMFTVKIYDKSTCEKDIGPAKTNIDRPIFHSESGNQNHERVTTQRCKPEICKADIEKKANLVTSRCLRSVQKPVIGVDEPTTRSAFPFKSENSYFRLTWTESHKYLMTIPRQLAMEKNLATEKMILLIDPSGRSWPVKLSIAADGRCNLHYGWPDFWKGNNIARGDTLVFEITQESAMKIHIFRAGEKTVPFKSKVFTPANAKSIKAE